MAKPLWPIYTVHVGFRVNLHDMWEWIEINCPDEAENGYFHQGSKRPGALGEVFFTDPKLAMEFKLRFSNI